MALFGAPIAHEDHAERACAAALDLARDLARFGDEVRRESGQELAVRMGLNSGEVVVGRIGDDLRMDYTAQGHVVGLAARVQQLAPPGGVSVTEDTARLVAGFFGLRDRGEHRLKGASVPVRVFDLRGQGPIRSRLERSRAQGFSRFVGREGELARLERALRDARSGRPRVVLITGEPGAGKSRLCDEFVARSPAWRSTMPARSPTGACSPSTRSPSWRAVSSASRPTPRRGTSAPRRSARWPARRLSTRSPRPSGWSFSRCLILRWPPRRWILRRGACGCFSPFVSSFRPGRGMASRCSGSRISNRSTRQATPRWRCSPSISGFGVGRRQSAAPRHRAARVPAGMVCPGRAHLAATAHRARRRGVARRLGWPRPRAGTHPLPDRRPRRRQSPLRRGDRPLARRARRAARYGARTPRRPRTMRRSHCQRPFRLFSPRASIGSPRATRTCCRPRR